MDPTDRVITNNYCIKFEPSIPGDLENALEKLKKCIQEIRA